MRRPLAVLLVLAACSSERTVTKRPPQASATIDDGASGAGATAPALPPPPALAPGQSQARVTGCSESAQPSERDAAQWPPLVLGSRRPSATEVQLGTQPGGVYVTHNLTHACCQKARVYVQQLPGKVSFVEALEGEACGADCLCTSAVQAAVGVAPGRTTVALQLQDTAGTTVVKELPVVVEAN